MSNLADMKAAHADSAPRRNSAAAPESGYKPRNEHPGQPSPHLGQTHIEKDQLQRAAREIDEGPRFGTRANRRRRTPTA